LGHFAKLDQAKNYITITPAFILAHIHRFKPGKASGSDGLHPEHLIYETVKSFEPLAIFISTLYRPTAYS